MRNLKQKWIAWLAVICMLAAMVPATALAVMADGDPIFSSLQVQFIGRLPSSDPKNGVFVSLSNDGETWTDPVAYAGHAPDRWGCANTVDYAYFGVIDVTEQAKSLTSDRFFVKVGMGAADITWTVLHQVRVVGIYTGSTSETEFFWEDYSNLNAFARTGDNAEAAAADVVKQVPYAVSANNVFLQQCNVDHQATGLSPYHGGYYGEPENVNAHVVYGINQPAADGVYFEFLGRMPGDVNDANKVQVMVGSDGNTWKEAALLEGPRDNHSESTRLVANITDAVDLTANNLYVKVNLISYLAEWCSARQMRVVHIVDGVENVLMDVNYDNMAIGSEDYKSGLYVDSANVQLRGTYDPAANDPSGLTMNEDCDGQDGKVLGDNYITYKIPLRESEVTGGRFSNLKLQFIHRLPSQGDTDAKSALQIFVSGDGENWSDAYVHTTQDSGKWGCDTFTTIDLSTLAANVTGNKLYIKVGMGAGDNGWCLIHQLRVEGTYADETAPIEFVWDQYEGLTPNAGTDNATAAAEVIDAIPGIVDANNVKLASCVVGGCNHTGIMPYHGGSYEETNGYITYAFDLKEVPVEPDEPVIPDDAIFSELLVQFIGRLPSNDPKNRLYVSLSNDGINWTESVEYGGHGMDVWGCSNSLSDPNVMTYFASIDVTEIAKSLTSDKFFVKVGMGAGNIDQVVLHQVRVAGIYVGETEQKDLFWDDYSSLPAFSRDGSNTAEAVEHLKANVPHIVDANLAFLQHCGVDHQATGISPYHGGYYGEPENVNGYVMYSINGATLPEEPELPYVYGGNSVSEDVSGLANIYNLTIDGIAVKENTTNVADFTNATFNGYKLLSVGAIATNGVASVDINGVNMYALNGNEVSFAFRVIDIPADMLDVEITMTLYVVVEIDGVATTLYGEPTTASYNSVLNG